MSESNQRVSSPSVLIAWCQLVRLPTVFTILADVSAGYLLVGHGAKPADRMLLVVLAGVCLYWAGMILNDVFDLAKDKAERSGRPLARGQISPSAAKVVAIGLMVVGALSGAASGYLPSSEYPVTWLPGLICGLLIVAIIAYDGPLKKTPIAPALMGACRTLSFLLGASPLLGTETGFEIPRYVLGIAIGFGTYIMGLTLFGRREADGGSSLNLPTGTLVIGLGSVMLAVAPQLARGNMNWNLPVGISFPLLVGMVAFPVVIRAFRAVRDPSPTKIQMTMKIGILTMIPLAAAFAFLGAGQFWGLAIFALVVPAMVLSSRLRVT